MRKAHSSRVKQVILFFLTIILLTPAFLFGQIQNQLKWEELPAIPDKEGYAGMFAGVSNGALIALGGANFPDKMPWEGGIKKWYNNIYILEKNGEAWKLADAKLPQPMAYGVSVTYEDRIILVGGSDAKQHYADVHTVRYEKGKIQLDTLVSLPFPLANMTGTLVGNVLYIAGGNTTPEGPPQHCFLALDLTVKPSNRHWQVLDAWPGPPRIQAVSASLQGHFFLFSGVDMTQKADSTSERLILKDAYRFVPTYKGGQFAGGQWKKLSDMPRGVAAGPSPAPTTGSDHILFPGGLDGTTAKHNDPATFPGFVTDLQAYHIESNSWLDFGDLPKGDTRVTAPVVNWDGQWVVLNGEKGPGKRSPQVFSLSKNAYFGVINWIALIAYLAFMLWIGVVFDKKGQTTQNFFTAGGKIPWWAAGLSIYGTQFSAISFMALPAIVYATDWSLALGSVMVVAVVPLVIKYYIPFFRRLSVTSAYEYLEHRFNGNVRVIGSLSFILFQLGRMGIVLFLPAIAIASVTGIDVYLVIAIMGVICILYTVLGGIEAVVWTDVAQVIILMGGAILCLIVAIANVENGLLGVLSQGMEAHKFRMIHFGWEPDKLVLWVGIVGFFFLNIIPFTSDQSIVQRYLTVKDEKATAQSLWTHVMVTLPAVVIFFGLGTVLYVFYHDNPSSIPSEQVGEVLPYFVVQELPVGIAGLIIAGIFAASQSTLSSSMNSVSAAYVTDLYPRLRTGSNDRDNLRMARIVSVTVGIFGVASAMLIAALDIEFIFDLFQEVLGIMGGTLAGVFVLGIFTKRANAHGVVWGIIIGVLTVWFTRTYTDISVYLYGAISVLTTVMVGYVVSLFAPQKKNLKNLTYFTLNKNKSKDNES